MLFFSLIIAYLIGSISSAVLICKAFSAPDPRELGSKNPGATNVLRVAGKLPAVLTLLADGLKGFLPVFLATKFATTPIFPSIVLVSVVFGHIFPIFFSFKGGKGVATAYGAFLGLSPMFGGIIFLSWLIILKLTKISSLAAILSCLEALVLAFYWFDNQIIVGGVVAVCILVLIRHQSNLMRLIEKEESKVG